MKISSQQIAEWTSGAWTREPNASIEGFCFDARQIKPGQCFVALHGGARDGHDFIEQAALGGAAAAIVESTISISLPQLQVEDSLLALSAIGAAVRLQFKHPVVGITGSCGKTSTKEMLRRLLGEERTHATAGNWNNRIGVPMTLFGLDSSRQDFAVIEAGINQPDEMYHLGKMIHADLNVLTHIGAAHLELLGDLDHVASEKAQLVEYAAADSPLILPAEALRYAAYTEFAERAIVLLAEGEQMPKVEPREIVHYKIITQTQGGRFAAEQQILVAGQTYQIASPSRGIATNAALAIIAAKQLGIAESDIRERIQAWRPAGHRGRIATFGEQTFYIDCYNANPSSMADALAAFVHSTSQHVARFYILGGMNELGNNRIAEHEAIGGLLDVRSQDQLAFVGPQELNDAYHDGAIAAGVAPSQMQCCDSIEKLKSAVAAFEGAIFLKGSRSYQLEGLLPKTTNS